MKVWVYGMIPIISADFHMLTEVQVVREHSAKNAATHNYIDTPWSRYEAGDKFIAHTHSSVIQFQKQKQCVINAISYFY